jgi:hypothetical protein
LSVFANFRFDLDALAQQFINGLVAIKQAFAGVAGGFIN